MSQYFSFQWHITDECDQRCKHCYIFSGEGCKTLKSMTWKQMQEVVANCEDFCKVYNRVPYFYITGGDPILHPDFWKLMVLLKSKNIPFTLMGNPFHLDDEVCRMLKACGCDKYQMSLDGMRETHDWFRKPGSFDLTLEKIGCLNRAGIKSVIMSTVSETNRKEIPDIMDAVVKANVKVFAFSRYVPTGGEVDTSMTPQEYRELLAICDKKIKAYEAQGCKTYFNKKDHLWTLYEYETGQFRLPENAKDGMVYGGCNCHITIASNGDVMACRRVTDSRVANVFEDRLADVWVCQMEKYRDYDKFKKCSRCELKAWCRGCPAVANGTSGDFYAADPQCWKEVYMDLATCLKKMELVGVLAFATVDSSGAPQIRNISAIHYEPDALYFFTARGKNFCKELQADGRVQILCYTKYKEMIRLSGKAYAVEEAQQIKWRDKIFEEQPYLTNVYPGDAREIGIVFCIDEGEVEYFNLGVNPIFRDIYHLGSATIETEKKLPAKGYYITDACIGCGNCQAKCPQRCIDAGTPFTIRQNNCLHCGNCYENCPVQAVTRAG